MTEEIKKILELINEDKRLIEKADICRDGGLHLNVTGICEQQKGYMAAALAMREGKKPVVIVPDIAAARAFETSIRPFIDGETVVLAPADLSLVSAVASSREPGTMRAGAVARISEGDFGAAIICAGALINRMMPKAVYDRNVLSIRLGDRIDPSDLTSKLIAMGYERTGQVSSPGEFSSRGDVTDIFTPDRSSPVRLVFFDDEIDQIKLFDISSQRSVDQLKKVRIFPADEILIENGRRKELSSAMQKAAFADMEKMDSTGNSKTADVLRKTTAADVEAVREGMRISGFARWLSLIYDDFSFIPDYIDRDKALVMIDEMGLSRSRIDQYTADYTASAKQAFEQGFAPVCAFDAPLRTDVMLKLLDRSGRITTLSCLKSTGNCLPGGKTVEVMSLSGENWRGRDHDLAQFVKDKNEGSEVFFLITGKRRTEALRDRLLEEEVSIRTIEVPLPSGFSYPDAGLILIGEQDVFGAQKKITSKRSSAGRIRTFDEIAPGDYVVHDAHGIGRYDGIVNMRMGRSNRDYLKIDYAKNAVIYLPVERLDKLSKYIGPAGRPPKLSSLDSGEWNKSVERARTAAKKVAFDLVKLYAARRRGKGYRCSPDDVWQKEFEENFPFTETGDQLAAIADIKKDMESDVPMDRLLCGDVGFGKTEVAFRAMFKCVSNGRQAFMLAPTTLLAQQHYDNLIERLGSFPVKVALLSRFVPAAQMKKNLEDIKDGNVDIVVGTHRLLSKDVVPHKLGLLVVDEEQRFGVNHKEQIKALRSNIDVLTLTATPIPRTLHMSMTGIRDISVLDEAPMNRRPVQTYVMGFDEEVIISACLREIARGGQVFYLYNKTADIDSKAAHLSEIMPNVRVVYAHGKMSEHQMEKIIESFIIGEADILVCTTIIESGVDMPNVNTMIVEDSDRFGLSQLYQIKGRVGRSDRQAYAYITYDPDKEMNSDSRKRLMAIREFTELGSGVKIALRDLEVRGAGNLLGAEQHGQMDVIGYELYCRILDEEIKALREDGDETFLPPPEVNLEVDFDSYIPSDYIDDETQRMLVYRRLGSVRNRDDYNDLTDEITDRYGDMPKEVVFLAGASLIRSMAADAGFERVCFKEAGVLLYFAGDRKMDFDAVGKLLGVPDFAGRILMCAQGKPYLHYKPKTKSHLSTVDEVTAILDILIEAKNTTRAAE